MPVHPIDLKFWESVLWGASTPNPRFLNQLNGLAVTNAAYYLMMDQKPTHTNPANHRLCPTQIHISDISNHTNKYLNKIDSFYYKEK